MVLLEISGLTIGASVAVFLIIVLLLVVLLRPGSGLSTLRTLMRMSC